MAKKQIPVSCRSKPRIPVAGFTYQMEWKGRILDDRRYWPWSACALQGPDGKVHLFADRADSERVEQHDICWGHRHCNVIAHYVADQPEGPFQFVDIPLPPGSPGEFDRSIIYPCLGKDGDRWLMMYTAFDDTGDDRNMRGALAVADSLYGPWRKLGVVLAPSQDPEHWTHQAELGIHVPQFVPFRGKWYAYFKSGGDASQSGGLTGVKCWWGKDYLGVAIADRPEGPWQIVNQPAILKNGGHVGCYIEDMHPFVWKDRMYLMISDNLGGVSGVAGSILLFESEDGQSFPFEKARLAVDLIPAYYREWNPQRIKCWWGPAGRLEPCRLLWRDGKPAYLYGGTGTNVDGGPTSCTYVMKIMKWALP